MLTRTNRVRDVWRRWSQYLKNAIDVALSLNPNFALAYNILGNIHNLSGTAAESNPGDRARHASPAPRQRRLKHLSQRSFESLCGFVKSRLPAKYAFECSDPV